MKFMRGNIRLWPPVIFLLVACTTTLEAATLVEIEELRLSGELSKALVLAEEQVRQPGISAVEKVARHLELARIHDRIGLHQNTRPVAESLVNIESALILAAEAGSASAAEIARPR